MEGRPGSASVDQLAYIHFRNFTLLCSGHVPHSVRRDFSLPLELRCIPENAIPVETKQLLFFRAYISAP